VVSHIDVLGAGVILMAAREGNRGLVVASDMVPKTSERRLLSQSASFMPCVAATFSLSVVERETISWRLEDQDTAPPSIRKAYPNIARLSSAMLPSVSACPTSVRLVSLHTITITKGSACRRGSGRCASQPPNARAQGSQRTGRPSPQRRQCRGASRALPN